MYDETCAECPVDSCPLMGTTPNFNKCIEATRKFECIPCPSSSPTEPMHLQRVNCTTCPVDNCSRRPGTYLHSMCNASAPVWNRTFTCGLCLGCTVRNYMPSWGECDGTKLFPSALRDSLCYPCTGYCKVGEYLSRLCTGRDMYDVEVRDGSKCKQCTPCQYGHYHSFHTKRAISRLVPTVKEYDVTEQACGGFGMFDSDGITDCKRCDTCPKGQYATDVGNCTGNNIWKVPFKCSACLPCEPGYEHEQPCDQGLGFTDKCKLCPACPNGTYISSYWNATSYRMVCTCVPCRVGSCSADQYRTNVSCSGNKTYDEGCADCSSCNAGEYIAVNGTLCDGLGFVDSTAGKCRPCRTACQVGYYLNGSDCLTGKDTVNRACVPCNTQCPFGFYAFGRCDGTSSVDTRKCVPCSSCLPGQIQTGFCYGNSTADTTTCRTCNATSCPPPQVRSLA